MDFLEENKLPFRRFTKFFFLKEANILPNTFRVQCTLCPGTRMLTTCRASSSNLLRHLKRAHPTAVSQLPPSYGPGLRGPSRPSPLKPRKPKQPAGSKNSETKRKKATSTVVAKPAIPQTQEAKVQVEDASALCRVDQLIADFIVNGLHPPQLVERAEFQNLITGLQPGISIVDRLRLGTIISDNANNLKQQLRSILSGISHVCLSMNGWRVFDKCYLGISVHWINPSTFERRSAVLCCRRLCEPHSLPDITALTRDLVKEFGIQSKIVQITTDNGLNFTKPYRIFGSDAKDEEKIITPERDYEFVELYPVFSGAQNSAAESVPLFERCAVHSMNLVATWDTRKAESDPLYRDSMREALFRCQSLWRLQGATLENAEFVKGKLGALLVEPDGNCWRSQYQALKHLRGLFGHKMDLLDEICNAFDVPKFREVDKVFIDEYCKVMRPVSAALDTLHSESNAFMGLLLPVVHALMRRLTHFRDQASSQDLLVVCYPLLEAVIDGLSERFESHMFRKDLVLASVLHPEFQLNWLKNSERETLATEYLKEAVREVYEEANPSDHSDDEDEDELFDFKRPTARNSDESKWQSEVEQFLSFSTGQIKGLSSYPLIKSLFLQYNSALPASAATEKTFVANADIFTLRGGAFNDASFEDMVMVKMGIM